MRLKPRQAANGLPKPECMSNDVENYNLGLHVGALFIVLFVSSTGCAFALVVSKIPKFKINHHFLFVIRHFGTGVLLATAFVHLLPTAFISLTDPCLPSFWNEDYPAMAGAIALVGVFLLTIIEQIFSPGRKICTHNVDSITKSPIQHQVCNNGHVQHISENETTHLSKGPFYNRKFPGRSHSVSQRISTLVSVTNPTQTQTQTQNRNQNQNQIQDQNQDQTQNQNQLHFQQSNDAIIETASNDTIDRIIPKPDTKSDHEIRMDGFIIDDRAIEARKKALMQCVMLEMGILFHSIFIGMALAVTTGNAHIVLLIAIIFHQTFEGLALGSRIADVGWKSGDIQPWIMALLYGCTTPLGQAIGIATRTLYSPGSATGLLVVGIFNALSSGFLTFNSLVDLLSEDFLSDKSWRVMRGKSRVIAIILVFFGAFCMSFVGAWA